MPDDTARPALEATRRPGGVGLRAADLVFGPTLACSGAGGPVPATAGAVQQHL